MAYFLLAMLKLFFLNFTVCEDINEHISGHYFIFT